MFDLNVNHTKKMFSFTNKTFSFLLSIPMVPLCLFSISVLSIHLTAVSLFSLIKPTVAVLFRLQQ